MLEMSTSINNEAVSQQLNVVLDRILKAANATQTSITAPYHLMAGVQNELRSRGFIVKLDMDRNDPYTTISWAMSKQSTVTTLFDRD
jgi:hypothetical protein